MLLDTLVRYLQDVESAIKELQGYVERYEEEIISPTRVNLRVRVRFANGYLLELNEAIVGEGEVIGHLGYRYHLQDKDNNLVFRYDNTPHYKSAHTFPHHKHVPDKVIGVQQPSIIDVIAEAKQRTNA